MKKDKEKDYVKEILTKLLKKYYKRQVKYGSLKNARRIILKITEVYPDYEKMNCDLQLKMQINEAAKKLDALQYISTDNLLYSDDIVKIYLNESKISDIESYGKLHYGITARYYLIEDIRRVISKYKHKGSITVYYCDKLKHTIENSSAEIDIDKEKEILKMLEFIQENQKDLYVREVSMLVYGSSKYFEKFRYESVCNIIREATVRELKEHESNDEILRQYHISNAWQEICIKGDYIIELKGYTLETKHFTGGISLSSKDISQIKKITVNVANILTIENKTAFYRFDKVEYVAIYLGGYASRHQATFLKKLFADNPLLNYYHFGDIDVGGFLIHQHLCGITNINFELFYMGIRELRNPKYKHCLSRLTEHDIERIAVLRKIPLYKAIITVMLEMGVKLEQEIVCLDIMGI